MSFYVDAGDQREKARRLEQKFLEHEGQRPHLLRQGAIRPPTSFQLPDSGVEIDLTRPIQQPDYEGHVPSTTPDKYAARFRDGLPPPPPPSRRATGEGPDPTQQPQRRLIPQELLDQGVRAQAPVPPPVLSYAKAYIVPPFESEKNGYDTMEMTAATTANASLSKSQKKRLRRQKAKLKNRTNGLGSAPFPLEIDQRYQQPALQEPISAPPPTPPYPAEPIVSPTRVRCDAEITLMMPDGTYHELICPLTPFPHPGQPHLVQLATTATGAEVFVGFWLPGE